MQYTIRNIPKPLDKAIRDRAKATRRTLNDIVLEMLLHGFRAIGQPVKRRDLSRFLGTWQEDPAFDEAREYFEQIDPEMWGLTDDANRARHQPVQRPATRQSGRRRSA